jgi:hypothetical protein
MELKEEHRLATGVRLIYVVLLLMITAASAIAAVPSIDQVYQAARSGHLPQAEAMTKEVLAAYPNSARAHYVMAQILVAEGRMSEARSYLEEAERLKPGLPFANPQSVANLERRLNNEGRLPAVPQPKRNQVPWLWLIIGGVLFFLVMRALRSRRAAATYGDRSVGAGPSAPGPMTPMGGGYGGWGGGLLGSVLAGLGFGAGAAAGERVMDRFLGGERTDQSMPEMQEPTSGAGDLGGNDFGMQPGDSSSAGWQDAGDQVSGNPDDDFGAGDSSDGGWDDSSGGGGDVNV